MRTLDVDFGDSPFELAIARLKAGDSFPAGRFLTLLEGEDEEAVEAAFDTLAERGIRLELSGIPKASPTGSGSARLHLEEKLAKSENIAEDLPEEDPLRLYLEELSQAEGDPMGEMLPKVVALAREYVGYGVLLTDLIQEGNLALWEAMASEGNAEEAARQGMIKAVTMQARANGVGSKMRQALEKYRAADERLLVRLGRTPLLEEIAQEAGISLEEAYTVSKMYEDAKLVASAHKKPEKNDEDEEKAVEDTAYFQMRQRISDLLSNLTPEEQKLLTLRFGLEGSGPQSPEQVGLALGLTAAEVVAAEAKALAKLRG